MDWEEMCERLKFARSINPAIFATENLFEEIQQFKQEQKRKINEAEDAIEALIQCLVLHQGEKMTEEALSQRQPFEEKITRVVEALEKLDM